MKIIDVIKKNAYSLIFVFVAFAMMAAVSFFSLYDILLIGISDKANLYVENAEEHMKADLLELELTVSNAATAVSNILKNGGNADDARNYIVSLTENITKNNEDSGIFVVYGCIGDEYIDGTLWSPLVDATDELYNYNGDTVPFELKKRPWYIAADAAVAGEVALCKPYIDSASGELVISGSAKVMVDGKVAGIVAADIYMNRFLNFIEEFDEKANGRIMIVDSNYNIIIHTIDEFNNLNLADKHPQYVDLLDTLADAETVTDIRLSNLDGANASVHGRYMNSASTVDESFSMLVVYALNEMNQNLWYTGTALCLFAILFAILLMGILTQFAVEKTDSKQESMSKSLFLTRISHEIRTPMNVIMGMSELIIREKPSPSIQDNAVAIRNAGNNLLLIINDIFNLSKIETGKMAVEAEDFILASVINDVTGIIRMRIIGNRVRMMVDIDPNLPAVIIGDRTKVRQMMLNLLANSVKYTEEGIIHLQLSKITLEDGKPGLCIKVKDTGIGIQENELKRIIESKPLATFKRWAAESTGLGLAITRAICKALGGEFLIESVFGEGTVIAITIPIKYDYNDFIPFAKVENKNDKYVLFYGERRVIAESIELSLKNLGVKYVRIQNLREVRSILHEFTHVLLPAFRYGSITAELKEYGVQGSPPQIILFTDISDNVKFRDVKTLTTPPHILSVANVLNGIDENHEEIGHDAERYPPYAPDAKILIVDDITANLLVMEGLLALYSIKTATAKRGTKAIEMVQAEEYDIVFMDHMMPEMDGIEATRHIRELEDDSFKMLPIIALTANAVSGMREVFLENGMNDFLPKPVEPDKLEDILFKWLPEEKIKKRDTLVKNTDETIEVGNDFTNTLGRIESISVERALTYAGGSHSLLENNVRMISGLLPGSAEKLDTLIKSDISLFAINIHGFKNMLANIGAYLLAERAKEIEGLAKEGEKDACNELYLLFKEDTMILIRQLQMLLSEPESKEPGDINDVYNAVERLNEAAEFFDSALALEIINNLIEYTYNEDINKLLTELFRAFEQFEFDKAAEIITQIKQYKEVAI